MADRTQQLIALGREHYNSGDYSTAEGYLSQAVNAAPTFPDLFNMLGVIYHSGGKFQMAQEAFEAALRLNPRYTEAALNLSVTCNDRGKYEQAREVYAKAVSSSGGGDLTIDPFARGKLANGHADLGAAYAGMGLYTDAAREYQRALELCPTFVDLRVKLGAVYRDMGEPASALAELERACVEHPTFAPARINLGLVLFSLGRVNDAITEWETVVATDADGEGGHFAKRANLYLRMVRDPHAPQAGSAVIPLSGPLPDDK